MAQASAQVSAKVLCRTPNQPDGGKGTNIDAWKFELIESAIRQSFQAADKGQLGFMALSKGTRTYLSEAQIAEIGSLGWFATTVILEMEFRGDLIATKVKGKKMLALT